MEISASSSTKRNETLCSDERNETLPSFAFVDDFAANGTNSPTLNKYYPLIAAEMTLSIICLLLLIAAYVRISEHRTGPGKNVLSLACCLIISYTLLIVDLSTRGRIAHTACIAISYTVHFTFLATFFWTNVMAYDIMHTMASMRPNVSLQGRKSRYWKYSLYSWTLTLMCAVTAIVIDYGELVPPPYRPKFGQTRCWLSGTPAFLLYFNAPVGIILASNCVLFAITARTIMTVNKATTLLETRQHKRRFRLYVKLVLVMGLVWITEFVPWATGYYKLYALAGALNSLHGVFMFLIFACKRRILKQVKETCSCSSTTNNQYIGRKTKSSSLATITTMTSISSKT